LLPEYDSIAVRSSRTQLFPIEYVVLLFSRALCIRTLPERRTATIITLGFLDSWGASGDGGADGDVASSTIHRWVMYDSASKFQ
jgi:hypothetical protein